MVLDQFIYFSMNQYVVIVILTREEGTENQTGGAIMFTIQMLRAMLVQILAAVLLSIPVWADLDSRSVVPPIQGDQPVTLHEDQHHGAQLTPTYRGGLSADSLKAGDLNLKNLGKGMDSSRTITNPHSSFNSIRPEEFQEHGARGSGIPLWRW
jgi:hypothetical protein